MAIRITHGKVSTAARFGIEAGKGEQKVREAAESQANARQQAQINANIAAASLRANADIQKTILNAQSRQEAMEFESFMRGESAKRAIAWEQEKTELRNQHDFDMLEQRRDVENQLKMADDQREKTKLQSKFSALDDAAERGDISPKKAQQEKLRLELGIGGAQSPIFKKKTESDIFGDFVQGRDGADGVAPEQDNSAKLLRFSSSVGKDDQAKIKEILKKNDPVEVRHALDILEAKEEVQSINPFKVFSPLSFAVQATKLGLASRKVLPKSIKKPSVTGAPSFSSFKQTSGSFR